MSEANFTCQGLFSLNWSTEITYYITDDPYWTSSECSRLPRYRIYALKKGVYESMVARFGEEFRCSQCGREFNLYDMVMSKPSRKGSKVKWYHLSCYEALLLD